MMFKYTTGAIAALAIGTFAAGGAPRKTPSRSASSYP